MHSELFLLGAVGTSGKVCLGQIQKVCWGQLQNHLRAARVSPLFPGATMILRGRVVGGSIAVAGWKASLLVLGGGTVAARVVLVHCQLAVVYQVNSGSLVFCKLCCCQVVAAGSRCASAGTAVCLAAITGQSLYQRSCPDARL